MKIMPIYDLRNKAEVALLMKRLDDDTVDSIEGLPDSMILLVPEKACPTMTLQDLKEKLSDKRRKKTELLRTNDGVPTDNHRTKRGL
nr:hypothetical protein [uncultured Lachnoanaerobaculum sp.]